MTTTTGRRGSGAGGGRGPGRAGEPVVAADAAAWLAGRLPDEWFDGPAEVSLDREEIIVVGRLHPPEVDGDAAALAAAELGRIGRFREDTRAGRVEIAREAEYRYGRALSWGAVCGGTRQLFTTASVPVMTRLRQPERLVLDTLVEAGVARSRSEALAWSVRLVGEHAEDWLARLRAAMTAVQEVRDAGPDATPAPAP